MSVTRREILQLAPLALAAGLAPEMVFGNTDKASKALFDIPPHGHMRLLHITDTHAQLLPIHYREPNVNIGVGVADGRPPHLVGHALLKHFGIPSHTRDAHATTFLDYVAEARRYGQMGGYAHIHTLVQRLRGQVKPDASLLLDGGDTWQGSATSMWNQGADMVEASNHLGVDVMTGHWEFTYGEDAVRKNIHAFKGDFVAQNVFLSDDAMFNGAPAFDPNSGLVFPPYSMKSIGGRRVAVIGQAFPYVPIAHPKRFVPDWTFGIHQDKLQALVNRLRTKEKPDLIVLLSHNGMDVDLKLASRVSGIDVIFGGHTHDAVPAPSTVKNPGGVTLVTNAGTNGKFVGVLDAEVGPGGLKSWRYKLVPVYSDLLSADRGMNEIIHRARKPHLKKLERKLAVAEELLYRRGNFNGTMDQVVCDAQRKVLDAEIAFSPGFRWGPSYVPGSMITFEDVMQHTAITYPNTYVNEMTGAQIKSTMEDVCDNLFNPDPYYQQGGDMVRVGGMNYTCDPTQKIGSRISDMVLDSGKPVDPDKKYKVAGWAAVSSIPDGKPIWDVVSEYLTDIKSVHLKRFNQPKLKNVDGNPGVADYT